MARKKLPARIAINFFTLPKPLAVSTEAGTRPKQIEAKNMTVPVYDDEEVVAEVEYNQELDHWDGHNYTCGSTGRHLGLTQLDDGRYVLIHGTQWQGEENTAEIISASQAVKEIIQSGNTDLFKTYPELQDLRASLPQESGDKKQSREQIKTYFT
jgi:hypothetical protein